MITILDYGAGNLQSVRNTLDEIGAPYLLTREASELAQAEKILLPGVGHFGQLLRAIDEFGLRATLQSRLADGVPYLGICLGMQALFDRSEEAPDQLGLSVCAGTVKRFTGNLRIPHMGWNSIDRIRDSKLLRGLPESPYVYFANSYYAPVVAATAASCTYAEPFTAVLEHGNIYGVQFHPEKSSVAGQHIVRNFVELD